MAAWLYARSRGLDSREVDGTRVRKSLGKEETFSTDILDSKLLLEELRLLSESVSRSLAKRNLLGRTITLKIKYADFESCTRSQSIENFINSFEEIFAIASSLIAKTEAGRRKIRLLGISLSNFNDEKDETDDQTEAATNMKQKKEPDQRALFEEIIESSAT